LQIRPRLPREDALQSDMPDTGVGGDGTKTPASHRVANIHDELAVDFTERVR